MEKLTIAGRTNWEKRIYIKFKATDSSINVIKKFVEEIGDEFFLDNQTIVKSLSNYEKWKDQWIPVVTNDFGIDIICGNKIIHMIFYKFPSFEFVNNILDKYCNWSQPKYKQGFGPVQSEN